jgi:hypothetical protein
MVIHERRVRYIRNGLRSLVAKNAITRENELATINQKGRQKQLPAALGTTLLCGSIAVVLTVAIGIESIKAFAALSSTETRQQVSDSHKTSALIQNTNIAISELVDHDYLFGDSDLSNFGPRRSRHSGTQVAIAREVEEGEIVICARRQDLGSTLLFSGMNSTLNMSRFSQAPSVVPVIAEGRLVQEFWRSMVSANVVERYLSYLHNYPSGAFADVASARIKELGKVTKVVSVDRDKARAKKKKNRSFRKTTQSQMSKRISARKTSTQIKAVRCQEGYPKTSKACINRNYRSTTKRGITGLSG